jgi:tripartite-type tricarboxylate transporter receptor subunit TctC
MTVLKSFLVSLALAGAAAAGAQTYPSKPVRLVVPFAPGGGVDVIGRVAAEAVSQGLGQSMVVENRAGAGGALGAESVARSAPDGYTLLLGTASTHGTASAVNAKLPYDPVKDFAPVILFATAPGVLVVTPSAGFGSVAELVAFAKANPGKLNFASYGPGSYNHLSTELLTSMAAIEVVHIPYKGSAPALADLIAGQVQFMIDTYTTSIGHAKSGKLAIIGITSPQRASFAPELPTLAESGLPGYAVESFYAVFAPAGTPATAVERLNREFNRVLQQPAMKERLQMLGVEPVGRGAEVLGQRVAKEVQTWRQLVKTQNLKFDQ